MKTLSRLSVLVLSLSAGAAFAVLPSGVSEGLNTIKGDGMAMIDLIWPVVIAITGAVVVLKLFKRFVNKV